MWMMSGQERERETESIRERERWVYIATVLPASIRVSPCLCNPKENLKSHRRKNNKMKKLKCVSMLVHTPQLICTAEDGCNPFHL